MYVWGVCTHAARKDSKFLIFWIFELKKIFNAGNGFKNTSFFKIF